MDSSQNEHSIIPWIGKTAKFIGYYFSDALKEQGIDLSKEQFLLLKYLHEQDGRIQNELAFITDRSKTSLTRLIQNMEKKGLVHRVVCREDMRIRYVYLTEIGKEIWARSQPLVREIIRELQVGISEEELQDTIRIMERIQQNIHKKTKIITS